MVEPDSRRAYVWVVSLSRHFRQHHLAPMPGVRVRVFERNVELTPPFPGEKAVLSLHGGESGLFELSSEKSLDADAILAAVTAGWGRGEARSTH